MVTVEILHVLHVVQISEYETIRLSLYGWYPSANSLICARSVLGFLNFMFGVTSLMRCLICPLK
jgi:hypothetical protein